MGDILDGIFESHYNDTQSKSDRLLVDRLRLKRDLQGQTRRYWNLQPSPKTRAQERDALRDWIHPHQSHTPLPELMERVNRYRKGWANDFRLGDPRKAFRQLNELVRSRLEKHLQRRSQRGWRAREGVSL